MSRYVISESPLEFEITRVDCISFLGLSREFPRNEKERIRINHGNRAIGVRVIEVLLHIKGMNLIFVEFISV